MIWAGVVAVYLAGVGGAVWLGTHDHPWLAFFCLVAAFSVSASVKGKGGTVGT